MAKAKKRPNGSEAAPAPVAGKAAKRKAKAKAPGDVLASPTPAAAEAPAGKRKKAKAQKAAGESPGSPKAAEEEAPVSSKKRLRKKRQGSAVLAEGEPAPKKGKKRKKLQQEEDGLQSAQKGAGHAADAIKRRKRRGGPPDGQSETGSAPDGARKAKRRRALEEGDAARDTGSAEEGGRKARRQQASEEDGEDGKAAKRRKKKAKDAPSQKEEKAPESDDDSFFGGGEEDQEEDEKKAKSKKIIDDFKVWVGDLPWECSEDEVKADFARFGEILRFDMPKNRKNLPDGVAYIYYANEKAMKKALVLDGQDYNGKEIKVKRAVPQNRVKKEEDAGRTNDELTVFVGGLPYGLEEEGLRASFGECGEIEAIRMLRGPSGNFKGIAFVVFKTLKAVRKALLRDGDELEGRAMKVSKPQERGKEGKGDGKGKGKGKGKDKGRDLTAMTVFVGSLPPDAKMEKIKEDFGECGPVDCVRMVKGPDGHFRGAAFVVFKTAAGAKKALEWSDQFYYGNRALRIAPARKGEKKDAEDEE